MIHWNKGAWRCTDTSDPRHFGPKTLRHHRDVSEMSRQFGTGSEVSMRQFRTSAEVSIRQLGTGAKLSAVRPLLTCDLSKNKQSCALHRCNGPTQRWEQWSQEDQSSLSHSWHFKPWLEQRNSSLLDVELSSFALSGCSAIFAWQISRSNSAGLSKVWMLTASPFTNN